MPSGWAPFVMLNASDDSPYPPGSGPDQKFDGPWFSTQLALSLVIGLTSFMTFCLLRTRWDLVYMGRTKLKDFSPVSAHSSDERKENRMFGWIMPTIKTSEFTVLQTVGLDAAVLLNFYRMAFLLFSVLACLAAIVLMPLNLLKHGSTDIDPDEGRHANRTSRNFDGITYNSTTPRSRTLSDVLVDPQTSAAINLLFAYIFTALVLIFLHRNYHRFIQARQTFSLHLLHSAAARTVLVSHVPRHLRGDRALADYFENCGWTVESVNVCREVDSLKRLLEKRTNALLKLESFWTDWLGNPARGTAGYSPNIYSVNRGLYRRSVAPPAQEPLIPDIESAESPSNPQIGPLPDVGGSPEERQNRIRTNRPRPMYRPKWFGNTVDAISFWEKEFLSEDRKVKQMRRKKEFEATHVAFVTFASVKDAQMACQVVHFPEHTKVVTRPAPEPRDVIWGNVSMSPREGRARHMLVMGVMIILLLFWIPPVTTLASLLSFEEIKKVAPRLAKVISSNPRLQAIVQNSLPSLAIITFNGLLPFVLSWLSHQQGYKSLSATEYSLLRKYHLFLLVTVLFIFLLTSTILSLIRDLADSPAKIPEKLASALLGSNARNFMISYVMLQSLGLMPLQLLNLGPLFTLGWARSTNAKTPRDHAEANAPPMLNYGWVYPQSLLVFTITLVFGVVSPLILIFGAIYFGAAYLVYKYKLLFIYFKPYESNGEAWRLTFTRLLWAVIIFQVFMTGLFSLRAPYWPSLAMVPLILYTTWWAWTTYHDFEPLSEFLALSSICEVERGREAERVVGVQEEGSTQLQNNLNYRRYHANDETLYVAPKDARTDYSQPPMSSFYYGVLNTGRRRYGHPALSGALPFPWLPAQSLTTAIGTGATMRRGVILSLRRKMAKKLNRGDDGDTQGAPGLPDGWATGRTSSSAPETSQSVTNGRMAGPPHSQMSTSSDPWRDSTTSRVVDSRGIESSTLPRSAYDDYAEEDYNVWGDNDSENEDSSPGNGDHAGTSPSTYFHHPERVRTLTENQSSTRSSNPPSTSIASEGRTPT